ncbi:MAG: hypothetical protein MPJ50_00280 [Pirellulales bacterium]|nr:hypothetical protein [Pirellulales bacterium]
MKADRKQHLQENELAKWAAPKIKAAKPYGLLILGISVALVAIIVTIALIQRSRAAAIEEQWAKVMQLTSDEYFFQRVERESQEITGQLTPQDYETIGDEIANELRTVIATDETSLAAIRGKLYLADRARSQGISAIFKDRIAAKGQLDEAIDLYKEISGVSEDVFVRERADFYRAESLIARSGLVSEEEFPNDLEAAKEIYKNLAQQTLFKQAAQKQLEILERPSTHDHGYFAWFNDELQRMERNSGSSSGGPDLGPTSTPGTDLPGMGSGILDSLDNLPSGIPSTSNSPVSGGL